MEGAWVEFRLLGAVEAWHSERRVALGHAKQRCVLAVLLVEAGRVVPVPTLIERVWGQEAPDGALSVLYGYIARLRRLLAPAGVRLPRGSGGYVLQVDPERVDLHRFRRFAARAGTDAATAEAADAALALWRGGPFGDLTSPWLAELAEVLVQQRLTVLVERNEAYLGLGRHAELIDGLVEATAAHPLDERLAGQLMLALYRCGRPADALAAYRCLRDRLVEHTGTEPGPQLRRLHQRILRGDPELAEPSAPDRPRGPLPVPAGLPRDVIGFVGRRAELAALDRLLAGDGADRTVVISVVHGTAGVGKTALAVRWAHRARRQFPDGNLYADLRGFGPGAPAEAGQVLEGFFSVLDVAPDRVPSDVDAKAALFRSLLDGRRMLVVLDNAANPQQVRHLLPGSPTCAVVITSRSTLGGLVARERAQAISLDVPPLNESVALLAGFIGADRVAAEPDAARSLASLCARLPVALCVAGELAASRPDYQLSKLVADLDPAGTRLDVLDAGGDLDTAVRAVLSWSFHSLPEDAGRLFRLLGLHPGQDLDRYAAAALAGMDPGGAARLLDTLTRAHLVQRDAASRYRMHDLLRAYAAERAAALDSAPLRDAALRRLADFYLCGAATAMETVVPASRGLRPAVTLPPGLALPALAEAAPARAWLDAERANIIAAAECAADAGWAKCACDIAAMLRLHLLVGSHLAEAARLHGVALRAAREAGDRAAEATASLNLGQVHSTADRYDQAARHFQDALRAYVASGDVAGEARALFNLGLARGAHGDHEAAREHLSRSITLHRELGDPTGEATSLGALGEVLTTSGRYAEAGDHLVRALRIADERGDTWTAGYLQGALGNAYLEWGRHDDARARFNLALAAFVESGDRRAEAEAVIGLAAVSRAKGRTGEAERGYRYALRVAREVGSRTEEAHALDGIGQVLYASGQPREACGYWREALAVFDERGAGAAEAVRLRLADVTAELAHRP